ncbi:MAG: hypothetical protein F6K21_21770 [Symploca sp. SIO2D2]|nr:hypothetical protein [Symploca sp. SIO2D2]
MSDDPFNRRYAAMLRDGYYLLPLLLRNTARLSPNFSPPAPPASSASSAPPAPPAPPASSAS